MTVDDEGRLLFPTRTSLCFGHLLFIDILRFVDFRNDPRRTAFPWGVLSWVEFFGVRFAVDVSGQVPRAIGFYDHADFIGPSAAFFLRHDMSPCGSQWQSDITHILVSLPLTCY